MSAGYTDLTVREFKQCVSKWANAFDPKYRTLLWVIGSNANKDGYDRYQSIEDIRREMQRALIKIGDRGGWVPAYSTTKLYLAELRQAGILETGQTRYQKRGKWVWGANIIEPNFNRILVDANAEKWDFLAVLVPDNPAPSHGLATDEPLNEPRTSHGLATRDVPNPSSEPKSQPGLEKRSSASVRSAPQPGGSGEEPGGKRSCWDFLRPPPPKKETVEDLEKKYGLDLGHLVKKYTLFVVKAVVGNTYLDWEETVPRKNRNQELWLAWFQQQGGLPWLVPKLNQTARVRGVVVSHAITD